MLNDDLLDELDRVKRVVGALSDTQSLEDLLHYADELECAIVANQWVPDVVIEL